MDLETAAAEISRASSLRPDSFFFMVGAGVSAPCIPLASQVIEDCRQRVKEAGKRVRMPDLDEDAYAVALEQAFPSRVARRDYFNELVRCAPLTLANMVLAQLLADGQLTRLVVTTNFDRQVEQGLDLHRAPYLVCDHPGMITRLDNPPPGHALVCHLHGSHLYYDLKNTRNEIDSVGEPEFADLRTFLDTQLRTKSPIVVGYSGWEHDMFMRTLRVRLEAQSMLAAPIYWFCYNRSAEASLPEWLRDHESVRCVAPAIHMVGDGEADKFSLPANQVLDAIARHAGLLAPEFVTDPLHALQLRVNLHIESHSDSAVPDRWGYHLVQPRLRAISECAGLLPLEATQALRERVLAGDLPGAVALAHDLGDDSDEWKDAKLISMTSTLPYVDPHADVASAHDMTRQLAADAFEREPSEKAAVVFGGLAAAVTLRALGTGGELPEWFKEAARSLVRVRRAFVPLLTCGLQNPANIEVCCDLCREFFAAQPDAGDDEEDLAMLLALTIIGTIIRADPGTADERIVAFSNSLSPGGQDAVRRAIEKLQRTELSAEQVHAATWVLQESTEPYPFPALDGQPLVVVNSWLDVAATVGRAALELGKPTKALSVGTTVVVTARFWDGDSKENATAFIRSLAGTLPAASKAQLLDSLRERLEWEG